MRNLTKKEISELEFKITSKGFTIWSKSDHRKDSVPFKHWLIDGSNFFETGKINIGVSGKDLGYDNFIEIENNFIMGKTLVVKTQRSKRKKR